MTGAGGQSGDAALMFREGLEVTERERGFSNFTLFVLRGGRADIGSNRKKKVFVLAQESAKKTKQWYESTDRSRR